MQTRLSMRTGEFNYERKIMKTGLIILMFFASVAVYAQTDQTAPPMPSQEQPEVLTRGPVHEAYAETC